MTVHHSGNIPVIFHYGNCINRDSCFCVHHQGSMALSKHPPAAPPAPLALRSGSPGCQLSWAAVSAAAGSELRLGGGLPPSEWNRFSPSQQLDGSGRPLWLQSALGSAQTAALSGRSSLSPSPPQPTQWQLRPLLYPLGPPLWHIQCVSAVFTSRVMIRTCSNPGVFTHSACITEGCFCRFLLTPDQLFICTFSKG